MKNKIIGVVGAGIMGTGVSQVFAHYEYKVVLIDLTTDALNKSKDIIRQNIRLQKLSHKRNSCPRYDSILSQINFTTDYTFLAECDFIVENVTENYNIKNVVYKKISQICSEDIVIAANTSSIPITNIANMTTRPSNVIGVHFMNPAPLIKMVEIACSEYTSDMTLNTTIKLMESLENDYVVLKDTPGFITNKIMMIIINEAIQQVDDCTASASDIDRIFVTCFGHKMGPLAIADLIGLDTVLYSLEELNFITNNDKYHPCPLLVRMVSNGLHGRKNGQGFYKYS